MPASTSVRTYQDDSQLKDFREILCLLFTKICRKFQLFGYDLTKMRDTLQ